MRLWPTASDCTGLERYSYTCTCPPTPAGSYLSPHPRLVPMHGKMAVAAPLLAPQHIPRPFAQYRSMVKAFARQRQQGPHWMVSLTAIALKRPKQPETAQSAPTESFPKIYPSTLATTGRREGLVEMYACEVLRTLARGYVAFFSRLATNTRTSF